MKWFDGARLYDRSRIGLVRVTGDDAVELIGRISTNDVSKLTPGGPGILNAFTTNKGRMIDLVASYLAGDGLWMLGSPDCGPPTAANIERYVFSEDCEAIDEGGDHAVFCVLGEDATRAIATASGLDIAGWPPFGQGTWTLNSGPALRVFHSAELPGGGYFVVAPAEAKTAAAAALEAGGADPSEIPSYESLRVAFGRPSAPGEISGKHNPLDLNLERAVDFEKGCYVGQEVVARLHYYEKVRRGLWGVRLDGVDPARPGDRVTLAGDAPKQIGVVTSSAPLPDGARAAAIILARAGLAEAGAAVQVLPPHDAGDPDRAPLPGELVELPFGKWRVDNG